MPLKCNVKITNNQYIKLKIKINTLSKRTKFTAFVTKKKFILAHPMPENTGKKEQKRCFCIFYKKKPSKNIARLHINIVTFYYPKLFYK